jgi:hypothetical protein
VRGSGEEEEGSCEKHGRTHKLHDG